MLRRLVALGVLLGCLAGVSVMSTLPIDAAKPCKKHCPPTPPPVDATPTPIGLVPPTTAPADTPPADVTPTPVPTMTPAPTTPPTPYSDPVVVQNAPVSGGTQLPAAPVGSFAPQPVGAGTSLAGFAIAAMVLLGLVAMTSFMLFLRLR